MFSLGAAGAVAAGFDSGVPSPAADGARGLPAFLDAITANTAALLGAERRKSEMMTAVTHIDCPVIGFAPAQLPYAVPADQYGPKDGWVWAIQRITIAGFAATSDFINIYKGESTADAIAMNALNTFSVAAVGAVATWTPGRTACLLQAGQRLAFSGTFTGTNCVITSEAIMLEKAKLPYFLL
jgi:hypothetical protein